MLCFWVKNDSWHVTMPKMLTKVCHLIMNSLMNKASKALKYFLKISSCIRNTFHLKCYLRWRIPFLSWIKCNRKNCGIWSKEQSEVVHEMPSHPKKKKNALLAAVYIPVSRHWSAHCSKTIKVVTLLV